MKTFPRYQVYTLFNEQDGMCFICKNEMSIHDMEVEYIADDGLMCHECCEAKKNFTSDLDNINSLIDSDLRIMSSFFHDTSYVNEACEQSEHESDIDPEEKIQNSWYHRAIIGDENREIYDDYKDTDFDEVERLWELKHEDEEILDFQQNSYILGLEFNN